MFPKTVQQATVTKLVSKGWMVRDWHRRGRHLCCRLWCHGCGRYAVTVTPTGRVIR